MQASWGRIQRAGAVALLAGSLAVGLLRCAVSDEVPYLRSTGPPWWMAPTPVSGSLEQWGRVAPPVTRFTRSFELGAVPTRAVVEVRALRGFQLWVNGAKPEGASGDGRDWRSVRRVEIAAQLREGANELRVAVRNRHGPGLLSLRTEGLGLDAAAPGAWQTAIEGKPLGAAIPADDTRVDPSAAEVESPYEGLRRSAGVLLALFALGAAGLALVPRLGGARVAAALPGAALGLMLLGWTWLFVAKVVRIPLLIGFDARHHLAYVEFIRERLALPLATDGWSTFHPPLFYAVAAGLQTFGDRALKVLPWIAGLGCVFVAHSLAGRLAPGDRRVALLAVVFAGVLPVNLYSAAYFTNETLHALLASLALLATVDALLAPDVSLPRAVSVGAWLGLAVLTKFTALALVPVALFFLACKLVAVDRAPWRETVRVAALAAAAVLVVGGWYYARNLWHFGVPILGNWGRMPGADQAWWQQPGFHTLAYYTGFGESLRHAYQAGFHSFWDGVYTTFWADGGIAGRVFAADRHGFWDYDFMSAGMWLGLFATALLAFGAVTAARDAFRDPDPRRRAALSFLLAACYAVGFSLAVLTASLPFFAQAKASYALCLVAPLALFFATGAARIDDWLVRRGLTPLRLVFAGALTATLGCFWLGFAS